MTVFDFDIRSLPFRWRHWCLAALLSASLCYAPDPPSGEELVKQELPDVYEALMARAEGEPQEREATVGFLNQWTIDDVVFFRNRLAGLMKSVRHHASSMTPAARQGYEKFVRGVLSEVHGNHLMRQKTVVLQAQFPNVKYMDDMALDAFGSISHPDGVIYTLMPTGQLLILGLMESKTGTAVWDSSQMGKGVRNWRQRGFILPNSTPLKRWDVKVIDGDRIYHLDEIDIAVNGHVTVRVEKRELDTSSIRIRTNEGEYPFQEVWIVNKGGYNIALHPRIPPSRIFFHVDGRDIPLPRVADGTLTERDTLFQKLTLLVGHNDDPSFRERGILSLSPLAMKAISRHFVANMAEQARRAAVTTPEPTAIPDFLRQQVNDWIHTHGAWPHSRDPDPLELRLPEQISLHGNHARIYVEALDTRSRYIQLLRQESLPQHSFRRHLLLAPHRSTEVEESLAYYLLLYEPPAIKFQEAHSAYARFQAAREGTDEPSIRRAFLEYAHAYASEFKSILPDSRMIADLQDPATCRAHASWKELFSSAKSAQILQLTPNLEGVSLGDIDLRPVTQTRSGPSPDAEPSDLTVPMLPDHYPADLPGQLRVYAKEYWEFPKTFGRKPSDPGVLIRKRMSKEGYTSAQAFVEAFDSEARYRVTLGDGLPPMHALQTALLKVTTINDNILDALQYYILIFERSETPSELTQAYMQSINAVEVAYETGEKLRIFMAHQQNIATTLAISEQTDELDEIDRIRVELYTAIEARQRERVAKILEELRAHFAKIIGKFPRVIPIVDQLISKGAPEWSAHFKKPDGWDFLLTPRSSSCGGLFEDTAPKKVARERK